MHPLARAYLSSFAEDAALVDIDIDVAEAHALALTRAGLFTRREAAKVLRAYERARRSARREAARADTPFHDIHPLVEKLVAEACGEAVGGRVHLGKSRNDQVAADICIFARRRALEIQDRVYQAQLGLIALATRDRDELMPAFTHTRPAQPSTVGHWALAWVDALARDRDRLLDAVRRFNECPLGAAAVGGSSVGVDRRIAARLLGFDGVRLNSLDATGARDHMLELLAGIAILMSTLSRLAGDLIHCSSDEVGVFAYPDEFADTSSAMPQKKNPDPLELLRARAAASAGELAGALAIVHGLPAGYSRDLQELKPALWRGFEVAASSSRVVAEIVIRLRVRPGRGAEVLDRGYAAALDLAEWLSLHRALPFRRAHFAVGVLVRALAARGRPFGSSNAEEASRILSEAAGRPLVLTPADWREASDLRRGAARRRDGGPGDFWVLLARSESALDRLGAAAGRIAAADARGRRELAAAVKRAARGC
jgi:argininosuccinate lyase